jgi:hypothetical protein
MDLDAIISRADHLRTYGNATNIGELAVMVMELARAVKMLQLPPSFTIEIPRERPKIDRPFDIPVNQGPLIK